ncbi:MAG: hypothetical protein AAB317_01850 [Nitrospirota bacterium]
MTIRPCKEITDTAQSGLSYRHFILGALLLLLELFVLTASPAHAIPAFARKYNISCSSCHTKPPRLNPFGEAFHMAGFQIPTVSEGEIKGKRRIGRVMSEIDFLNIFSARTTGDFIRSYSGSQQEEISITLPQDLSLYLAGAFTDGISYFFELEYEAIGIEGEKEDKFKEESQFGLGKEFFFMFHLPTLFSRSGLSGMAGMADGSGGMNHGSGSMIHGPMVMAGKIDPSTNFSYPTNRQLILNLPGKVNPNLGTIERFGLTPYAFASKFFGVMTADHKSVEVTRSVLYNTPGNLGIDTHIVIGPALIQVGIMEGFESGPNDSNPKKDPYFMGRIDFGGANYLSGSLSSLVYRGYDTARVPIGGNQTALVDWLRYGFAGNIRYRLLDLYGAFIWDTLKGLPDGMAETFDKEASGFTIEGDYLITDQALLSMRYDQLNSGGLITKKANGKVLTAQARYYLRDNFSFYLRDSYNIEKTSKNPLQNFRNLVALGVDFDF